MISPSPLDAQRQYEPPPEPSLLSRIPWGILFVCLVIFGLGGWLWYRFDWAYRLPQEHAITDKQGQAIQARLEARNNEVLKYTLLADNSTCYVTIASLSDKDQEFVQQLPSSLTFSYPFECWMSVAGGKPMEIRLEGHNADWVRYTLLADRTTHFSPVASFSNSDQVVLSQLSNSLMVEPPLDCAMTDQTGQALPGHVDGRSSELARFSSSSGTVLYYPLRDLSALDQKLVRLMRVDLSDRFPFECTLTDKNDKKLNVRLEGRSANTVKYTLLSDGLSYYVPAIDFSALDQEVFRLLPANLEFILPFDYTLTDIKGQSLRVRLEARNANVVKFTLLETGREYYWPTSAFSAESQGFLRLLPNELRLGFPIDYTLTSQTGQALQAHILGRNADSVKFDLDDGKTYTVALSKLSDESQVFLQLLPANLIDASTPSEVKPVVPSTTAPSPLEGLRASLAALVAKDRILQDDLDKAHPVMPVTRNYGGNIISSNASSQPLRDALQLKLDGNRDQMEKICKQINPLLDPAPLQGKARQAQITWNRLMDIIKHDDQIQRDMADANPTERELNRSDIRKNQVNLLAALNEINVAIGTYSP